MHKGPQYRGCLTRLRREDRGNVTAIAALAIFMLAGMGGGGLDMARIYLIKSRLQQACDAGVLAYRRSMQGTNVVPLTYPAALSFFNANFSPGRYGSFNTQFPVPSVDANVVVHGTASTVVPTSIMQIFGIRQVSLQTKCDAQLQLPNSDVMFVLDTTLSMTQTNPGDSTSKISALRNAVQNFYNTLQSAKVSGTQVRYGFVPYSSTVNVGLLLKPEWLADSWHYQSREQEEPPVPVAGGTQGATVTTSSAWTQQSGTMNTSTSTIPPENCVAPANTQTSSTTSSAWSPSASSLPRSRTDTQTINGSTFSASLSSSGVCTVTEKRYSNYVQTRTTTVQQNPNAGQTGNGSYQYFWNYKQIDYPQIAGLKLSNGNGTAAGGSFDTMIGNNFTRKTIYWDASHGACIEERDAPNDMNVDLVPTSGMPATQWRPALPGLVYARSMTAYNPPAGSWTFAPVLRTTTNYVSMTDSGAIPSLHASCPTASRKLDAALTPSALSSYLSSLTPGGKTYHDVGFMWGLRLMSAEGLFASENGATPTGGSISRNLIFMTDGDTETDNSDYEAFGLSALDRRRTDPSSVPTNAQQDTIVEDRLSTLCTLAKTQKNITVWVIAFGTSLTPLLSNCASSGRAYQANNSAELDATFAEIAAKISQLRLTR